MLGKCEVNLNLTEWRKEIIQMLDIFKLYRPFYSTSNVVVTGKSLSNQDKNAYFLAVNITSVAFYVM